MSASFSCNKNWATVCPRSPGRFYMVSLYKMGQDLLDIQFIAIYSIFFLKECWKLEIFKITLCFAKINVNDKNKLYLFLLVHLALYLIVPT